MNQRSTENLDAFEVALLNQLHAVVDQQAVVTPPPVLRGGSTRWQQKRRWQVAGAAAAVVAGIALLVPALAPTPAYAVTGRNGGEVHVQVNRLEGADGLEQALAEHGITADITYLPPNKECAADRYTVVPTPGLTLSVSAYKFKVTIPADSVGKDETFVLDASVLPISNGVQARVNFDIARGTIAPCAVVDSP